MIVATRGEDLILILGAIFLPTKEKIRKLVFYQKSSKQCLLHSSITEVAKRRKKAQSIQTIRRQSFRFKQSKTAMHSLHNWDGFLHYATHPSSLPHCQLAYKHQIFSSLG